VNPIGVQGLGRYIIADPEICHGKPTFRGTRIFVDDVLEQIARGMDWEVIIEQRLWIINGFLCAEPHLNLSQKGEQMQ